MTTRCGSLAMIIILGISQFSVAQARRRDKPSFGVSVNYVQLSATVYKGRNLVADLGKNDFRIYENGYPQEIDFFQAGSSRLMVLVLIDSSASMNSPLEPNERKTRLEFAKEESLDFLGMLSPEDKKAVIFFNNRVHGTVTEDSFKSIPELKSDMTYIFGYGETALFRSLYVVLHEFAMVEVPSDGEVWQKAVIILSDGIDTMSEAGEFVLIQQDELVRQIREKQIVVYTISTQSRAHWSPRFRARFHEFDENLRVIAQEGGGAAYFPEHAGRLSSEYQKIFDELYSRYLFAYRSTYAGEPRTWRWLTVHALCEGCQVRSRRGYFAP